MEQEPGFENEHTDERLDGLAGFAVSSEVEYTPEVVALAHPRIWVGDWAAYNEGKLHGEWIDAARDADELWADVRSMLARSPVPNAEEYGIFDYEEFYDIRLGEGESMEFVSALAKAVAEHGAPFAAWFSNLGEDITDDMTERFEEAYIGHFSDERSVGDYLTDMLGIDDELERLLVNFPQAWAMYVRFDVDMFLRDLDYGGDMYTHRNADGSIECYWSH